jgi:hypothetical protein
MDYTEQELEAVRANLRAFDTGDPDDLALFLEAVAEMIEDGEVLERVAAAIRDFTDGVA